MLIILADRGTILGDGAGEGSDSGRGGEVIGPPGSCGVVPPAGRKGANGFRQPPIKGSCCVAGARRVVAVALSL